MEENATVQETKFCKECGQKIAKKAVICPLCGCQVEETKTEAPQIVINNSNQNQNTNNNVNFGVPYGARMRNKWTAFFLCLCLGYLGAHKFYEGKIGSGLLYMFTGGLFGIGWVCNTISLLFKPNPYFVV